MKDDGSKYIRTIHPRCTDGKQQPIQVDVYNVLDAFGVTNPGIQHAIKKLLCAGLRGKASALQDLEDSIVSIQRGIDLHQKETPNPPKPNEP